MHCMDKEWGLSLASLKLVVVVHLLFSSTRIATSLECVEQQCFLIKDDFQKCKNTEELMSNNTSTINLTFALSYDDSMNTSRDADLLMLVLAGEDIVSEYLSHILALVCHEMGLLSGQSLNQEGVPSTVPLCFIMEPVTMGTCDSSYCRNTSCVSSAVRIIDTLTMTDVSPSMMVAILHQSLTALYLARVPLIEASLIPSPPPQEGSGFSVLGDVPVVSWVFVAIGIIVSMLTLSQPIWWNRMIKKIFRRHKSDVVNS